MVKNFISKDFPSLTAVIHAAVKKAPSGLDAKTVADLVDRPYQTLMSELSRQEGHKLSADLVLPLYEATGARIIPCFLARQMGGAFIELPDPGACEAGLTRGLVDSVKEFGDFAAETAQNIADGDIPADQLSRIEKEADEAIEAILAMKKLARAAHERQYGGGK